MGLSYSKETESESDYVPMENSIPIFQPLNFRAVPPIAQPSKETSPKNHDPSQLTKLQLPKKPVSNSTSSTPVSSFSGEGNESPLISPTTEKKKPREIEIIHKDFKKLFEYSSTLNPEMAFIKADKITICEVSSFFNARFLQWQLRSTHLNDNVILKVDKNSFFEKECTKNECIKKHVLIAAMKIKIAT